MSTRYRCSEEMLAEALKVIPLGTQTFSKSKTQFPFGASPYFIERGQGSRVWDVDGNEYIDFINGLSSITLGYNDPDVKTAVTAQLEKGTIFSLAHPIEAKVARKLAEMVPCAEMARFGKNGSDATAGAIRLARAYTGRDHVAACGYHGWQDWYIGATARNKGVPKAVQDLTHLFAYNNLASLEAIFAQYPGQVAAVILEPMNIAEPAPGFLAGVKELAGRHGALLIFDETITGFRFANGGAQELFGVTPDLATLGKGMANGYPVSALVGRADLMQLMEEIFFSFTFGGEALSLAASLAAMEKLQREPVLATIHARGRKVLASIQDIIQQEELADIINVSGHPSWIFIIFKDYGSTNQWHIKTLFLQEMFVRGILTFGTLNMSFAHSEADIQTLLAATREVFSIIKDAVKNQKLDRYLKCQPLQPLFKVR